MTLPVIPSASSLTTPAQVAEIATALVAWAETVEDIAQVKDASAKWAAICEYVRRTSREGVLEAEGALRRLELRVGQLLGEASASNQHSVDQSASAVGRDQRHDFRQMAAHPQIVEQVIASSTNSDPPSRAKVLREIKTQTFREQLAEQTAWAQRLTEQSGYNQAEAEQRGVIFSAITEAHEAMQRLAKNAPVDRIAWALASTPKPLAHLADFARSELAELLDIATRYQPQEPDAA